ncbi:hypothetical protein BS636_11890 [Acinetobacter sp. LoGeW2-3]|uniref:DUF2799 domain-containing protein n=1 Tax=Acinetobacter sp. LoGeW2-3 TaxID=1808001 RepID=UPI000C05823C|nr:DUF2799 domain-containing protein [Acinetobacter sp. LoGeW2-3]ATO20317.1 hypothetical protein BS636_11890 [Acinetobacter sp. LoGeW2-3]
MRLVHVVLTASVLLLSGCTVMSVKECQVADWMDVGQRDGAAGRYNRFTQYEKACAKGNIQPNQSLYDVGYTKGRFDYCQPVNIFHASLNGGGSYQVCPYAQHAELKPYHEVAAQYYQAKKAQDEWFDELERYQSYLLDPKLTKENRDSYIHRIRELKIKQERIEFNYFDAERKLARFKREHDL